MRHLESVVRGLASEPEAFSAVRLGKSRCAELKVAVIFQTFNPLLTSASSAYEILSRP